MAEEFTIKIEGLESLVGKLDGNTLLGPVLTRLLGKAAVTGANAAKAYAPSDTGQLRQNIVHQLPGDAIPLWASVESMMFYGPYVEFGTPPHWPPPGALAAWAATHDIPEYLVRRKIGLYGTRAQPFMAPAVEDINKVLPGLIAEAESQIAQIWESK